ncbi:MAG TPA: ATP-binding protein [Streptosporangiaceae bacterium]|nr:ATP-binding protein [Streptosporangiaceae bacterium]
MALTALHPQPWAGGRSWPLPGDATCARRARALVVDTLAALDVPAETIADAELMVSELATNAHQHADGHVPFELWLSIVDGRELYCAIFDTLRMRKLAGPVSAEKCDFGRGLGIVAELSGGHWGMARAWSQRLPRVAGKAVWFGCPIPPSTGLDVTWDAF